MKTSPFSLLQEELCHDPWKMFVACILLNRTSHKQVRPVIWSIFETYQSAHALASADHATLSAMLRPLGLQNRRAQTLIRFSADYARSGTSDVGALHGVGRYALDSHAMFVEGDVATCEPTDKKLLMYKEWWQSGRADEL